MRLVRAEMTRYMRQKDDFVIEDWGSNLYNVQNKAYGTTCQVILDKETGCDCTFNSSFAIACRPIFAVRFSLTDSMTDDSIFIQQDYHRRSHKQSTESRELFPIYHEYLKHAIHEDFDDDIVKETEEHVYSRHIRLTRTDRYAEIRKIKKLLDVAVTDTTDGFLDRIAEVKQVVDNILAGRPPCDNLDNTIDFPQCESSEGVYSKSPNVKCSMPPKKHQTKGVNEWNGIPVIALANATRRSRPTKSGKKDSEFNKTKSQRAMQHHV